MLLFSATLRLPSRTPSVRRPSRVRTVLTMGFAAMVFATLPLRLLLAAASIAPWTTSWRTIELMTMPFLAPFELFAPLEHVVIGYITIAELLATGVFGFLAVYLLALLTVRRRR